MSPAKQKTVRILSFANISNYTATESRGAGEQGIPGGHCTESRGAGEQGIPGGHCTESRGAGYSWGSLH